MKNKIEKIVEEKDVEVMETNAEEVIILAEAGLQINIPKSAENSKYFLEGSRPSVPSQNEAEVASSSLKVGRNITEISNPLEAVHKTSVVTEDLEKRVSSSQIKEAQENGPMFCKGEGDSIKIENNISENSGPSESAQHSVTGGFSGRETETDVWKNSNRKRKVSPYQQKRQARRREAHMAKLAELASENEKIFLQDSGSLEAGQPESKPTETEHGSEQSPTSGDLICENRRYSDSVLDSGAAESVHLNETDHKLLDRRKNSRDEEASKQFPEKGNESEAADSCLEIEDDSSRNSGPSEPAQTSATEGFLEPTSETGVRKRTKRKRVRLTWSQKRAKRRAKKASENGKNPSQNSGTLQAGQHGASLDPVLATSSRSQEPGQISTNRGIPSLSSLSTSPSILQLTPRMLASLRERLLQSPFLLRNPSILSLALGIPILNQGTPSGIQGIPLMMQTNVSRSLPKEEANSSWKKEDQTRNEESTRDSSRNQNSLSEVRVNPAGNQLKSENSSRDFDNTSRYQTRSNESNTSHHLDYSLGNRRSPSPSGSTSRAHDQFKNSSKSQDSSPRNFNNERSTNSPNQFDKDHERSSERESSEKDDLTKVIISENSVLTIEELMYMRNAISHEIDRIQAGPTPRFNNTYLKSEGIVVESADYWSRDWLIDRVPRLQPWRGAQLRVIDPPKVEVFHRAVLWIPGMVENAEIVLGRLERQNPGLKTGNWRVYCGEEKFKPRGYDLIVGIPDSCLVALRRLDFRPYLGMNRVAITINSTENL